MYTNMSSESLYNNTNKPNMCTFAASDTGYLELILGPMFSGKSSRLVEIYKQCKMCNISVTVINHTIDNRYHDTMLSTHDRVMIPCIQTDTLMDLWADTIDWDNVESIPRVKDKFRVRTSSVILINEGQFFADLELFVKILLADGKKVYVCSLDGDYERKRIGFTLDLIPLCDKVYKLTSLCSLCKNGTKGVFSKRISDETGQIVVGSTNYVAVCRTCHEKCNSSAAAIVDETTDEAACLKEGGEDKALNARTDEVDKQLVYYPAHKPRGHTIELTDDSYVVVSMLPLKLLNYGATKFDQLFDLHPEQRHVIIDKNGNNFDVFRWQKSYLNTPDYDETDEYFKSHFYMYSGTNTSKNNDNLPAEFAPFYEYVKGLDSRYNQVVINWYDSDDHIAFHRDCQRKLVKDVPILVLSLTAAKCDDECKKFEIIPYESNPECVVPFYSNVKIVSRHGTIVKMCGEFQTEFRHGVRPGNNDAKRISMSFRAVHCMGTM